MAKENNVKIPIWALGLICGAVLTLMGWGANAIYTNIMDGIARNYTIAEETKKLATENRNYLSGLSGRMADMEKDSS
jgi:hypothetical protein